MKRPPNPPSSRAPGGFTFVELIVAVALSALVLTATIMAYGTIMRDREGGGLNLDVTLPDELMTDFYGSNGTVVAVSRAPNLSAAAAAESLRLRFVEDVSTATAVFALDRNVPSTYRPATLALGGFDPRTLSSPEDFRDFLASEAPETTAIFQGFEGASVGSGSTVFILNTSDSATTLNVRAVYETDLITTTSPAGIYASVRRYAGGICTDYYHVFFPGAAGGMAPLLAYFERRALPLSGDQAVDRFRVAAERPFYFIWWPDPSSRTLSSTLPAELLASSDPRQAYANQAGRTSFFFVVPAFPSL
ncbi:MAG: prepilin-type N-terminal cleavage/methylation domain-containing protein [Terrimicrobiaceae bacterium]|nr:prepilin-type N-terminal cleavage/methylation domain-containing protein [Terrimicrobiaceae bacterium]